MQNIHGTACYTGTLVCVRIYMYLCFMYGCVVVFQTEGQQDGCGTVTGEPDVTSPGADSQVRESAASLLVIARLSVV